LTGECDQVCKDGANRGRQEIGMAGVAKRRLVPVAIAIGLSAVVPPASASDTDKPQTELRCPVRDPDHIFMRPVWSWKEIKTRNVVMQNRDYSCGAASLCTLLQYYWGDKVTEQKVLDTVDGMLKPAERKDRIKNGLSLTDLRRASVKLGYVASIGTVTFDQLSESKIPVLVGLKVEKFDHFVVFRGTDGYWVYLADPARGNIRATIKDFTDHWQKNAILVVAKQDQDLKESSPLKLSPEETFYGTLNRVVIQKQVATPNLFPFNATRAR
jgi:uncharacterized protein